MTHAERAARFIGPTGARAGWHDKALWFMRTKRDRAVADVPEWEELRERASTIKAHTLAHLDDYLERFEANATRLGAVVHWARDAAEARRVVHGILRDAGVRRVVKSKSMLTEECGLNSYLESQGIEVTDTDLGERIVQFREERPSHIVMPAIHLKKEEIGELFHRELGTEEGLSDPTRLTRAAREHLRGKFLAAEAGITGVNFAVAETGGFVVVTNEGNADLGTSLPPLHVACMGLEKIVPRRTDLAVFLRILARSATGQPITTYSSHFHGPRPGGRQHIVVIDNGRSDLLASDDFRRSLSCIRCGACMNTCPVYRRSGGHSYDATVPGPIGSILEAARDGDRHATLPFACTACGSCTDVCPVGIDLHPQLLKMRNVLAKAGRTPIAKRTAMRVAAWVLRSPTRTAWARRLLRRVPPDWLDGAWGKDRALPEPPPRSFREEWRGKTP